MIKNGVSLFLLGGYGQFDNLCYSILTELKVKYPKIKRLYVRPYYEELNQDIIDLYLQDYDDCIYLKPKNSFGKLQIIYRNYAMVDISDYIVFYVNKQTGGASYVFKYAKQKKKNIVNFADSF